MDDQITLTNYFGWEQAGLKQVSLGSSLNQTHYWVGTLKFQHEAGPWDACEVVLREKTTAQDWANRVRPGWIKVVKPHYNGSSPYGQTWIGWVPISALVPADGSVAVLADEVVKDRQAVVALMRQDYDLNMNPPAKKPLAYSYAPPPPSPKEEGGDPQGIWE